MNERLYRFLRVIARAIIAIFFPIRAEGLANIPAEGPVMLCSNHVSNLDPVLTACAVPRPVRFFAKKELFGVRFFGGFLRKVGAFPVTRGGADLGAVRMALQILREGGMLGIYPQGHRFKRDDNRAMEAGTAMIALKSNAIVIPVHVSPPYRLFRRVHLRFGAPVPLADLSGRADTASLADATARIAKGIWGDCACA